MAGGSIGSINIHQWQGPAPAVVKSQVDVVYRPGQATASAKVLPNQSTESQFSSTTFIGQSTAHSHADSFRSLIGTVVALTYHGVSYGNVLVKDVTIEEVSSMIAALGVHPNGTPYLFSPAAKIVARWMIVRLS